MASSDQSGDLRDQVHQLHIALSTQPVIEQAKGMIMERFKVGALQAFELLRQLSQTTNTPLAEVAQQIIAAEAPEPTT